MARIQTGAAAQAAFTGYYMSSNPAASPSGGLAPFLAYGCALDALTVTDFTACYCRP